MSGQRAVAYLGASQDEGRPAGKPQRALAMADQPGLFRHYGSLTLTSDALDLGGWTTRTPDQVTRIELTFPPLYSRWLAAGVRGRNAGFGLFASLDKPLVLSVHGESPLDLLIDFRWFTGINQARAWAPRIASWAGNPQTDEQEPPIVTAPVGEVVTWHPSTGTGEGR